MRSRRSTLRRLAAVLLGAAAVVWLGLMLASRSKPWLVGAQNEPRWAWAIGSGRLKVWVARPGVFGAGDWWTNSNYRGLDGVPLRWGFSCSRGSIVIVAVPLWTLALASAGAAGGCWFRHDSRAGAGACGRCGYDRGGLSAAATCPECGAKPAT